MTYHWLQRMFNFPGIKRVDGIDTRSTYKIHVFAILHRPLTTEVQDYLIVLRTETDSYSINIKARIH